MHKANDNWDNDFNLQYVRPPVVWELWRTKVCADLSRIKNERDSFIARWFRRDAKDYEYMLLSVVKDNGESDFKYIGIGHLKELDTIGHMDFFKEDANDTVDFDNLIILIDFF